jgi:hypothetical protein
VPDAAPRVGVGEGRRGGAAVGRAGLLEVDDVRPRFPEAARPRVAVALRLLDVRLGEARPVDVRPEVRPPVRAAVREDVRPAGLRPADPRLAELRRLDVRLPALRELAPRPPDEPRLADAPRPRDVP